MPHLHDLAWALYAAAAVVVAVAALVGAVTWQRRRLARRLARRVSPWVRVQPVPGHVVDDDWVRRSS